MSEKPTQQQKPTQPKINKLQGIDPLPFSEVIGKGIGDRKSTVTKGNFYLLVIDARNESSFSHFWLTKFAVYNVRES